MAQQPNKELTIARVMSLVREETEKTLSQLEARLRILLEANDGGVNGSRVVELARQDPDHLIACYKTYCSGDLDRIYGRHYVDCLWVEPSVERLGLRASDLR